MNITTAKKLGVFKDVLLDRQIEEIVHQLSKLHGLEKIIFEKTLSAPCTSFKLSDYGVVLNGDADMVYEITAWINNGYNGNCNFGIQANDDSAANYGYRYVYASGSTITTDVSSSMSFFQIANITALSHRSFVTATLYASAGASRIMRSFSNSYVAKTITHKLDLDGAWDNNSANITDLKFSANQANGIGAGSWFKITTPMRAG